jgi:transposase InsO family protein
MGDTGGMLSRMPWNETAPMNERVKFIARYLQKEDCFAALCEHAGISRKTGYKWVERYDGGGVEALVDRSRAPHEHPNAMSTEVVDGILALRRKHPRWGPRKLLAVLERRKPDVDWPVPSTVGRLLKCRGLVRPRRRRRCSAPYAERLREYAAPNAIWCADFKGHFGVGDRRCHPLTITDGFSRYLLCCRGLRRPFFGQVQPVFESVFRQFGLPETIRTDNGPPFSTLAPGGLSRLAVWWIRLGIRPERILPGRPDQNGRHERMHSTLKAETAHPPRSSFRAQQRAFDAFRQEYNHERPHEALNYDTPASRYEPSGRPYPQRLPEPEYPDHFEVVRAYPNGVISFADTQWYVSLCLAGELVGLKEMDDDRWTVYFGPLELGVLDVRNATERGYRQFGRLVRTDGALKKRRRRHRSHR